VSTTQLHGKGMRQVISIQGMEGYVIVTPTTGWTFMPFRGQTEVTAMSQEDVKQAQNELDTHGSLLEYKEKGHTVELAGKEDINGTECYKLLLTLTSGKKETIYIDSKSYYAVRSVTTQRTDGQEQQVETNYSGFEKFPEGIVVARLIALPYGTMTVNTIKVNTVVNEEMFKPTYNIDRNNEPR
jgi:outer membrane lipoprotein-sorting protein